MNDLTLYVCDPEKNTECKKTACSAKDVVLPCSLTTKAEFAKTDENGQPIAATDDELPF